MWRAVRYEWSTSYPFCVYLTDIHFLEYHEYVIVIRHCIVEILIYSGSKCFIRVWHYSTALAWMCCLKQNVMHWCAQVETFCLLCLVCSFGSIWELKNTKHGLSMVHINWWLGMAVFVCIAEISPRFSHRVVSARVNKIRPVALHHPSLPNVLTNSWSNQHL